MIEYKDIQRVELELSSYCNASCPLCPRNLFGYNYNSGYTIRHLTLDDIKKILNKDFLFQLKGIKIEGNFGDFAMNPDTPDIVRYILEQNSNVKINGHTNGSVQSTDYWKKLKDIEISFGIDGIKGTHEIYRKNTNYDKIIDNATAFIHAGGKATWKMIKFDHNKDQIDQCKHIAEDLGFFRFEVVDHGRNSGPVFNNDGELEYVLGNYTGETDFKKILEIIKNGDILLEDINDTKKDFLDCGTIKRKEIYIDSTGKVYPCCFMGFNPNEYGHGRWHQPVNKQISQIMQNNNALDVGIENSLQWFNHITKKWNIDTFEKGRLIVCDSMCGKCNEL